MRNGHKYGAVATVVDGVRFSSKAEAKRYGELLLLQRAGLIKELELQPPFRLEAATRQRCPLIGIYKADFRYLDTRTGAVIVEDVKGYLTDLYRWKKKHVEAQYGIVITEVRA